MFEIQHAPNPQSDGIWAESRDHVPPVHTVKQPAELMVWRAMSAESLTELHIVSKNQTVNIESYVPQILEGSFFSDTHPFRRNMACYREENGQYQVQSHFYERQGAIIHVKTHP